MYKYLIDMFYLNNKGTFLQVTGLSSQLIDIPTVFKTYLY